ncbi:hypothetical protein N6H14_16485 [Paenibacillus sp. CC-CFT747]|nr:hypothetical protein N6H14_16485 [Paenibacillus sp. CC-CFT747]
MLTAAKYALLLLLFLLLFASLRGFLHLFIGERKARLRLIYSRSSPWEDKVTGWAEKLQGLTVHLKDLLESNRTRMSVRMFLSVSFFLLLGGFSCGFLLFYNIKGVLSLTAILGALPYLLMRMRLISLQLKTRLDFLPAVEVFYQCYVLSAHPNIRNVLRTALADDRIRYPLKPVFEQLHLNLSTSREAEDSLRIFALTLGHHWGDYFVSIIRIGMLEGNDVSANLRDLVMDMRRAQLFDQNERTRLMEIRIASFSPVLFLGVFLFVNFKINYNNAYTYYVLDPGEGTCCSMRG